MSSKWIQQLICALMLISLGGCSLPLGETPPEAVPPESGFGDSTKCLDHIVPNFEKFIEGTSSKAEVMATWDCMGSVVSLFQDSVRGRYEDRFTDRELANFVERNFLDDKPVTAATMTEIFKVKQLLVGGAVNYISRDEMTRFVQVIRQIRDIAVRLNPYMKVYSFHWKIQGYTTLDSDIKYFESANLEMQGAVKDLAVIIEKNGQGYKLDSIVTLLKEVSQFADTSWSWLKTLEEAMPLVKNLKKTLTGGSPEEVLPMEWRRFALLGGRGFVQYLRYYYFVKSVETIGSGPELVYIIRSIDDLFSYLGDMVDGKPEKTLTRAELLEFCQSLGTLIPDFRISDEFLVELMKIKVLFFGGQISLFEKADFDRARAKLEAFRTLTEKFLSYADIYGLSWNVGESSPEEAQKLYRLAEENLTEFGKRLGETFETGYDLNDISKLIAAYEDLYPVKNDGKSLAETVSQYVPSVIVLKNIIFSDDDSIIGHVTSVPARISKQQLDQIQDQWSEFLTTGAQAYARFLYFYYFIKGKEFLQGTELQYFSFFVKDSTAFLETIIKKKAANPVSTIHFAEFHQLWEAVVKAKLVPDKISVKSLDGITKMMMQKLLIDPKKRLAGILPDGLTVAALEQFKLEFSIWFENQEYLDLIYMNIPAEQGKMGALILDDLNKATETEGLAELKLIYKTPVALSFDNQERLYLGKPELPYLRKTSDFINILRSLARLVIRSYAMDEKRFVAKSGSVTLPESQSLFADVQPLVIELGILDPRNDKFMENRFRDGNLFSPWGNGDDYLDFKEINDLSLMIWSGITIDTVLFKEVEKNCAITKPSVYKDDWTVSLDCIYGVYKKEIPQQLGAMPDFTKFLAQSDEAKYSDVFINLLKGAGYVPVPQGTVKVGDLALFPHIVQYVETVFQKFDVNRDGFLDTPESMAAFPTFKNILKVAAGGKLKSDKQLKGLFAWLLKYKKAPEGVSEFAKFLLWWLPKGEKGWDLHADRETVAKILGFIADAVNKDPKARTVIPDEVPEGSDKEERPVRDRSSK